jgi:trk system potassium uptake protein
VVLDSTDEDALRAVGVDETDGAVVAIGENVGATILTVSIMSELGLPLIVARAVTAVEARILGKVGATRVVYPEDDTASNVANSLVADYVVDYFAISPELSVARMTAPDFFVGRTLRELEIRARYNVSVVAIDRPSPPGEGEDARKASRYVLNMPGPDATIDNDDLLVLLGTRKVIERIQQAVAKGHA